MCFIANFIRGKCQNLLHPQHISLAEHIIPYSASCKIRQYAPSKSKPLALNFFCLHQMS